MNTAFNCGGMVALGLLLTQGLPETRAQQTDSGYDTAAYARVLETFVDAQGRVDYASLTRDRADLDRYVSQLATLDRADYVDWSEKEQLAFWINAYNALTLKAVIDHYPVDSIRDIGSLLTSVWDKLTFTVLGESYTLNNIEHDIIRKEFSEPRIHVAVNCASIGCPPLAAEPLDADRLEEQFDVLARRFLADPANFRIDRDADTVWVSRIFKWYGDDFIDAYGSTPRIDGLNTRDDAVIRYIANHVSDADRATLLAGGYRVDHLEYDWSLNRQ